MKNTPQVPEEEEEEKPDEPKSALTIFHEQLRKGLTEHHRSPKGLFLSAFSAGLEVGFTLLLGGLVYTQFYEQLSPSVLHLALAMCYPIGFIFVIIGRSELFTEHTTLAVIPVLNRSATALSLLQVWGIVYAGNLLGGYLIAFILTQLGASMNIISEAAFHHLALKLVDHSIMVIVGSSMLAGWLMGLLSWLVTSAQETISRIFIIILITSLIGLGGLHHSIVGSIEVFAGCLVSDIPLAAYGKFQLWSTVGNIGGGVLFVSLLKYSTIRLSKS